MRSKESGNGRAGRQTDVSLPATQEKFSVVVEVAREAVRLHAGNPLCWLRLGEALVMSNELDEAVAVFLDGLARHPAHRDLAMATAEALFQAGEAGRTLDLLERCLRQWPEDLRARLRRFELLLTAGPLDDAAHAAKELQVEHAQQLLAKGLLDAGSRYRLALALALSGRETEAAKLLPMKDVVSIVELAPPAQFSGGVQFRAELKREILANDTLTTDPPGKATRGGMQTRDLMKHPAPAVAALVEAIMQQVDAYGQNNAALLGIGPQRAQMMAWAVVYGESGFQTSHIHPQGWLSGVYYVGPEGGDAGALVLGALPENYGIAPPWGVMRVAPMAGRLVLFPSWLPHAAERAGGGGQRISVAFDVVPIS
jgi:hypothetical protein